MKTKPVKIKSAAQAFKLHSELKSCWSYETALSQKILIYIAELLEAKPPKRPMSRDICAKVKNNPASREGLEVKPKNRKTKPALWTQMKGGIKPRKLAKVLRTERQVIRARRIKPVSNSRSKQMKEYIKARRKWLQGRFCEAGGVKVAGEWVCRMGNHEATDVHHRKGRANKLLNDQQFWMALCRPAHAWIDSHRTLAKQFGWILPNWNSMPKEPK